MSDTFFDDLDKSYMDILNQDITNVRGVEALYWSKRDQTRRIDGEAPLQTPPSVEPVLGLRKRTGTYAMYGEPVTVGERVDSVRRRVTLDWNYADPIKVKGIAFDDSSDEDADERGTTYARTITFDISRVVADGVGIRPRQGDIIQLLSTLGGFYDIEDVSKSNSRFGGTGNFTVYSCTLVRNTKFVPQRKTPPRGQGYESL